MQYTFLETVIGKIYIFGNNNIVQRILLPGHHKTKDLIEKSEISNGQFDICKNQLLEYFDKKRVKFSFDYELKATDFQKSVYLQLKQIPFGKTTTYKNIAVELNKPKASRAIGMANSNNPLPILFPCHRVTGQSGKLVGFTPSVKIQQMLLNIEKAARLG